MGRHRREPHTEPIRAVAPPRAVHRPPAVARRRAPKSLSVACAGLAALGVAGGLGGLAGSSTSAAAETGTAPGSLPSAPRQVPPVVRSWSTPSLPSIGVLPTADAPSTSADTRTSSPTPNQQPEGPVATLTAVRPGPTGPAIATIEITTPEAGTTAPSSDVPATTPTTTATSTAPASTAPASTPPASTTPPLLCLPLPLLCPTEPAPPDDEPLP